MKSILSDKRFHNEKAAYRFVEARAWPEGPICPHCGGVDSISPMKGKSTRIGSYKCYQCRKPFTVKVGTIFESSHVPMHHWLQAIFLVSSSKKGISANQLHRTLGCSLKTAWFIGHRIREAMKLIGFNPVGGEGKVVEMDETHSGDKHVVVTRTKRGMKGTYQHCAEKHLHRYLAKFDFRYNNRVALGVNDLDRADVLLKGVAGKRLTYRTVN